MSLKFKVGDCREILPIEADVCITDPPYAVDKKGEMLGQIAANYHEKGTHTRGYYDHDPEQFRLLLEPAFDGIFKSLPKGGSLVAFCGNRTMDEMIQHAKKAGFQVMDYLVFKGGSSFAKSKTTLAPRYEMAVWMRKKGGVSEINPERKYTNFFDIPKTRGESEHPTTKPQSWMRPLVEIFSQPGQTILDPFAGSGSTLIAAHTLGRSAVGIESIEEYGEIVKRRVRELLAKERPQ